jgi:tRNA threonylcarbamoyladenosine biosynthesis protein TsaB
VRRHSAFFQQRWGNKVIVLDQSYEHPLPATLLAAAAGQAYARKPIEPLYLRPSDAEANLSEIARKAGLDAAAMAQRLAAFTS